MSVKITAAVVRASTRAPLAATLAALALTASPSMARAPRAADPPLRPSDEAAAGLRLAERHCGACHGMAGRASPLPDAPTFEALRQRYAPGCLDSLLTEGMLAPLRPAEEGSARRHPRMPQASLEDDEVAALRAYLQSLDPRPAPASPVCGVRRLDLRGINKPPLGGAIL